MSPHKKASDNGTSLPKTGSDRDYREVILRMVVTLLVNFLTSKMKEKQAAKKAGRKAARKAGKEKPAPAPIAKKAPTGVGKRSVGLTRREAKKIKKAKARKRHKKLRFVVILALAVAAVIYSRTADK